MEVGGLTPEVEYSLTAQAKNNQGRSDYVTPPVTVTTLSELIHTLLECVEASQMITSKYVHYILSDVIYFVLFD